eukprot:jgi/Botrbrau1/18320/Bobra.0179s0048.1
MWDRVKYKVCSSKQREYPREVQARLTDEDRAELEAMSLQDLIEKYKNLRKERTSKFKGVSWHKKSNKWQACIKINRTTKYLGLHEREEDAAIAYEMEARRQGRTKKWKFPESLEGAHAQSHQQPEDQQEEQRQAREETGRQPWPQSCQEPQDQSLRQNRFGPLGWPRVQDWESGKQANRHDPLSGHLQLHDSERLRNEPKEQARVQPPVESSQVQQTLLEHGQVRYPPDFYQQALPSDLHQRPYQAPATDSFVQKANYRRHHNSSGTRLTHQWDATHTYQPFILSTLLRVTVLPSPLQWGTSDTAHCKIPSTSGHYTLQNPQHDGRYTLQNPQHVGHYTMQNPQHDGHCALQSPQHVGHYTLQAHQEIAYGNEKSGRHSYEQPLRQSRVQSFRQPTFCKYSRPRVQVGDQRSRHYDPLQGQLQVHDSEYPRNGPQEQTRGLPHVLPSEAQEYVGTYDGDATQPYNNMLQDLPQYQSQETSAILPNFDELYYGTLPGP